MTGELWRMQVQRKHRYGETRQNKQTHPQHSPTTPKIEKPRTCNNGQGDSHQRPSDDFQA
jgi:hypothetical protein